MNRESNWKFILITAVLRISYTYMFLWRTCMSICITICIQRRSSIFPCSYRSNSVPCPSWTLQTWFIMEHHFCDTNPYRLHYSLQTRKLVADGPWPMSQCFIFLAASNFLKNPKNQMLGYFTFLRIIKNNLHLFIFGTLYLSVKLIR